jgi:hypothetical protein
MPSGTFTDQALEPAVHANASGGVAVSYYDFRDDVSGDGTLTTDHWIVHSHDGGATWTDNHLGGSFDMHQAPYARGYFVGDYQASTPRATSSGRCSHSRARASVASPTQTRPTCSSTARAKRSSRRQPREGPSPGPSPCLGLSAESNDQRNDCEAAHHERRSLGPVSRASPPCRRR